MFFLADVFLVFADLRVSSLWNSIVKLFGISFVNSFVISFVKSCIHLQKVWYQNFLSNFVALGSSALFCFAYLCWFVQIFWLLLSILSSILASICRRCAGRLCWNLRSLIPSLHLSPLIYGESSARRAEQPIHIMWCFWENPLNTVEKPQRTRTKRVTPLCLLHGWNLYAFFDFFGHSTEVAPLSLLQMDIVG